MAQKPRIGGAENAAATSAFATFEFATVSADQTPNAVAATIPAKPMIPSLRIGLPLRVPCESASTSHGTHPPPVIAVTKWRNLAEPRALASVQSERRIASRAERGIVRVACVLLAHGSPVLWQ